MKKIKAHINEKGKLEVSDDQLEKIINKDIDIIVREDKIEERNDFFELLENGPKAKGPKGKITKKWIHNRGENDSRHR